MVVTGILKFEALKGKAYKFRLSQEEIDQNTLPEFFNDLVIDT